MSFTATISMSLWPATRCASTARQKLRPIRPNPFTPTRTVTPCLLRRLAGRLVSPKTLAPGPTDQHTSFGIDPQEGCEEALAGPRTGLRRRCPSAFGATPRGNAERSDVFEHLGGDDRLGVRDAQVGGP